MELDDERWVALSGGRRTWFDPRPALARLALGDAESAWNEMWSNLVHDDRIGEASYASVPHIVKIHRARGVPDWNTYALISSIEEVRGVGGNPKLPAWLHRDYVAAWADLQVLALAEFPAARCDELVESILSVLAFSKGRITLGRLALLTESERRAMLDCGAAEGATPCRR